MQYATLCAHSPLINELEQRRNCITFKNHRKLFKKHFISGVNYQFFNYMYYWASSKSLVWIH